MTAPSFPAAWGQAPAQPAPQYPPAAGGYPPAQPQQFPPAAPQAYGQPMAPQYPPAQPGQYYQPQPGLPGGYPPAFDPYAAAQAPQFTPAGGTLDEYMNQRPAGAAFWKFPNPGHVNIGMVKRDLRDSDVQQVTFNGQPVRRKDGSFSQEKSINIPVVNADGTEAIWEVKGADRTVLEDAVSAGSGGARKLPEGGSMLRVTFTHTEPSRGGGSPRKVKQVEYVPAEQVQGGTPAAAPQQPAQPNPVPTAPGHPQFDPNAYAAWMAGQQQAVAQPAPAQAPPQHNGSAEHTQWANQATAATMSPFPGQPQYPAQPTQDLQYATPVPGAQQYQHPQMQAPAAAPQGFPQQAAPAQQVPQAAAFSPQAQQAPAPGPSPTPAGAYPQQPQGQGAPAPQPYAPPGMDPAAAQMFAGLIGGAPAQ